MTFWKVEKAEQEEKDNEDVFGKMVVTGTKNMFKRSFVLNTT